MTSSTSLKQAPEGLPGQRGRYEIVAQLASGGMGTVYVGRATGAGGFERLVAIKCCHPHLRDDPEFRAMFLDEARLAAFIHHPNVVATLDVHDDETLFLVMEYVEGGRLSDLVSEARERDAHVPVDILVRLFCDALHGLHAAHRQTGPDGAPLGIIHRDVSPQNLLVGIDGVTRVVDFGVAKAEARATVTTDHRIKGKLRYMSPEQISRAGISQRSDLFSAGAVLWEALTGHRLFHGDSQLEIAQEITSVPIRRPSSRREGIPAGLEAIVMRALERNPSERFESALDMATALESAGITPATHRRVGEYVVEALGAQIDRRRQMLREARQTRLESESASAAWEERMETGVTQAAARPDRHSKRRRLHRLSKRGRLLVAGALALLVTLAAASWLAWPGGGEGREHGADGIPEIAGPTAQPQPASEEPVHGAAHAPQTAPTTPEPGEPASQASDPRETDPAASPADPPESASERRRRIRTRRPVGPAETMRYRPDRI